LRVTPQSPSIPFPVESSQPRRRSSTSWRSYMSAAAFTHRSRRQRCRARSRSRTITAYHRHAVAAMSTLRFIGSSSPRTQTRMVTDLRNARQDVERFGRLRPQARRPSMCGSRIRRAWSDRRSYSLARSRKDGLIWRITDSLTRRPNLAHLCRLGRCTKWVG